MRYFIVYNLEFFIINGDFNYSKWKYNYIIGSRYIKTIECAQIPRIGEHVMYFANKISYQRHQVVDIVHIIEKLGVGDKNRIQIFLSPNISFKITKPWWKFW